MVNKMWHNDPRKEAKLAELRGHFLSCFQHHFRMHRAAIYPLDRSGNLAYPCLKHSTIAFSFAGTLNVMTDALHLKTTLQSFVPPPVIAVSWGDHFHCWKAGFRIRPMWLESLSFWGFSITARFQSMIRVSCCVLLANFHDNRGSSYLRKNLLETN